MHIARPSTYAIAGSVAPGAAAYASLAIAGLEAVAEFADRAATIGVLDLVGWLAIATRALSRQNADLAERQAELHERVAAQADRSHVAAQEVARQLGYLHADRREDDQHRIAVLTQIKHQGRRLGELADRLDLVQVDAYARAYLPGVEDRNRGN